MVNTPSDQNNEPSKLFKGFKSLTKLALVGTGAYFLPNVVDYTGTHLDANKEVMEGINYLTQWGRYPLAYLASNWVDRGNDGMFGVVSKTLFKSALITNLGLDISSALEWNDPIKNFYKDFPTWLKGTSLLIPFVGPTIDAVINDRATPSP